ncbi:Ribosomal RNA small subunit methyltransferase D [Buchnera aphidicola (Eriosoma lanigerum)]
MKINKKKHGKIRITGGFLKNSIIRIHRNSIIRPTTSFIREKLFNWLNSYIKHANCLDCFAGSGVLGIESISRYAQSVTFIDNNKKVILDLNNNVKKINILNHVKIVHNNILRWLKQNNCIYQIVFIDPPFNHQIINKTVNYLEKYNCLTSNSFIYIEKKNDLLLIDIPKKWILYKSTKTKNIACYLYVKQY